MGVRKEGSASRLSRLRDSAVVTQGDALEGADPGMQRLHPSYSAERLPEDAGSHPRPFALQHLSGFE